MVSLDFIGMDREFSNIHKNILNLKYFLKRKA